MTTENEVAAADVSTWVERQLKELKFTFERTDDDFSFNLGIQNCKIKCVNVAIHVIGTQIVGYAVPYLSVSEELRAMVAELITRINYNLFYGCWQMDYCDGEIRYVYKIPLPTTEMSTREAQRHILGIILGTYSAYTDAILAVLCGAKTAEEAIYDLEGDDEEEEEGGDDEDEEFDDEDSF